MANISTQNFTIFCLKLQLATDSLHLVWSSETMHIALEKSNQYPDWKSRFFKGHTSTTDSAVRKTLTSIMTYYLVDNKLRVTIDLDMPYTKAQCSFQAMNQSKILSRIVRHISPKILANKSPAIWPCGAEQNCPNASISTRMWSHSSIKKQIVWEGICTWTTTRIEPVLQFKQAKFVEYPSAWLLVTSSRWFKLHTFADEPTSVAQVSHKP